MSTLLLVLAPFPPRLDGTHGGSRAIAQLHARLADRQTVAILCLQGPGQPPVDAELRRRCELVHEVTVSNGSRRTLQTARSLLRLAPRWVARSWSPSFAAVLRRTVARWRPDVIQCEYHVMGQYMTMLGPATCPTVLRQLEPGSAAARDQARGQPGARRLAHLIERPLWDRYERRLLEQMSAVVALTVRDAESMRELAPAARIVRIPLGTEIPTRAADPLGGNPPSLLFTGNFVHPPNVSAATRLANTILPLVRAVVPDAELRVVGPAPPAALRGRTREGIFALGEVPDLWPFLDAASLVVAPLHEGGGMRVKVAEALAAGKAVVASGRAVEGLAVASGDQLLLAETDDAVAAACVRLLRSSEVRAGLARRARAWAERHLGWDAPVTAFEQLYASLRD